MPAARVLQRILLFLNPAVGQSVERVYELVGLYDDITPAAAERMVAIWRASGEKRPTYEPAIFDDEKRRARPDAAAVQRQPMTQPRRMTLNRR